MPTEPLFITGANSGIGAVALNLWVIESNKPSDADAGP